MHTDKTHDQSHDKESIKELCKCHNEAIKCHEAGDHKAAAVCSEKAHEHATKATLADKACAMHSAKLQSTVKK